MNRVRAISSGLAPRTLPPDPGPILSAPRRNFEIGETISIQTERSACGLKSVGVDLCRPKGGPPDRDPEAPIRDQRHRPNLYAIASCPAPAWVAAGRPLCLIRNCGSGKTPSPSMATRLHRTPDPREDPRRLPR